MKKFILTISMLILSIPAFAQYHQHNHYNRGLSVGEVIVLGAFGAAIYNSTQPRVIVTPAPVIVSPQPYYQADPCSGAQYYNGQYNPTLAYSYCQGQVASEYQRRRAMEQEAYRQGYSQ